ncbi:MAG TPA: L-threonylcarbamoyladenylate synthase [Candidatus Ozemobacteraceae bacterium]|nr:L-threonylcarbamoyladenylate synthase [Candidatus Ozemobacteraceae bacterium]
MSQYRLSIPELLKSDDLWRTFVSEMKRGAVAALPTDTLYGLAADAHSSEGVRAIYEAKGRGEEKPLILFLPDVAGLVKLGIEPEPRVRRILERHWPGGLTAIFPICGKPLQAFDHPTLGVRIPAHAELLRLLARYPGVLLTTSANISGKPPLPDAASIASLFADHVGWVLDGGRLEPSPPSTVADFSTWPPRILRQGKIAISI